MLVKLLNITAVLGAFAIGITLWAWGQPLTSASGEITLWVNSIWSSENSQQIADWYTLSHVIHGMLVALIGKAIFRWTGYVPIYVIAIGTGVAWEIIEHTDWVLGAFRDTTIYQGYIGDSVLNAVMDYVFMMGGFFLAWSLRAGWVTLLIVGLEGGSAYMARDSLTVSTLNLLYPLDAIEAWQDEINPRTHPELLGEGAKP